MAVFVLFLFYSPKKDEEGIDKRFSKDKNRKNALVDGTDVVFLMIFFSPISL